MDKYILEGKIPVLCDDLEKLGKFFKEGSDNRRVALTEKLGTTVSTVFLVIDHNFGKGLPVLFETMVFKEGNSTEETRRYSTWEEAEEGHLEVCEKVFSKSVGE